MRAWWIFWSAMPAMAGSIDVQVTDARGMPDDDVAVYAEPLAGPAPKGKLTAVIDQINKEFVPLLTIVQAGTSVTFPNKDNIRHSIYSFSPAKTFELKLYSGTPAKPQVFDKPGKVVLGCNIHDWMVGYVWVVESPWFGKTDRTGNVHLDGMPEGEYAVEIWHPYQALPVNKQRIKVGDAKSRVAFQMTLTPPPARGETN